MNLHTQISQLCQTILLFQSTIEPLRQHLFTTHSLTDQLAWHIVFGSLQKCSKQHLYSFIHKNGSTVTMRQCELIMRRYNRYGDGQLDMEEFWVMFRPGKLAMVEEIVKMRNMKSVRSNNPASDIRLRQKIIQIIHMTIQYEQHAQKMKENIKLCQQQFHEFALKKVQAKYLQIYLIPYISDIRIKDCQVILNHILGCHQNRDKAFYKFFFHNEKEENGHKNEDTCNPIPQVVDCGMADSNLKLYHKSSKIWKYGKDYPNHHSPLYTKFNK